MHYALHIDPPCLHGYGYKTEMGSEWIEVVTGYNILLR